jgi:type I restriction enzyme M protein
MDIFITRREKMELLDNKVITDGINKGFFSLIQEKGKSKIIYIHSSNHKEIITDPEEIVRAELYLELVEKYKYPVNRISLEIEMPDRTPDRFADIVIYEDDQKTLPFIVIECKKDGISDAMFEQATKQTIANSRVLKSKYAFCVAGLTRRAMETDLWTDKDPEKATLTDIPISYGNIEEFRYRKGDPEWDLKPVSKQELKRALKKAHDTLWDGGKRNPTVAFDELCKIIFVKIRDERVAPQKNVVIGTTDR